MHWYWGVVKLLALLVFLSVVCEFVSDVGVNNHDDSNFTQQASVGCSPALLALLVGRARLRPLVLAVPST